MKSLILSTVAFVMITASQTKAADTVLMLVNIAYEKVANIPSIRPVSDLKRRFERSGFDVFYGPNQSISDSLNLQRRALQNVREGDQLIIVMAGHFATVASSSYLLQSKTVGVDRFSAHLVGTSIDALLEFASISPKQSIVITIFDPAVKLSPKPGVKYIPDSNSVPEHVTYVSGTPDQSIQFINDALLSRNPLPLQSSVNRSGVAAQGHLPDQPFGVVAFENQDSAEQELWAFAVELGTVQAYEAYLGRYPQGKYARQARQRISALSETPQDRAKREEEILSLNRSQRQQIQSDLTVLGFDTRGVDGVFGRGTRRAIAQWQQESGFDVTGFLTRDQIRSLTRSAQQKRADEERRIAQERAEREAADAAYWRATGRGRTADGIRQYLERFPQGLYADLARDRLATLDPPKPAGPSEAIIQRDKREERQVAGNGISRLLAEQALKNIGLNPGRVDGLFDDQTRNAIRTFQQRANLPDTGYLGRSTFARLIAK